MITTKKYKSLNKEKIVLYLTEILLGSNSIIVASTLSIVHLSSGISITNTPLLIISIANLITKEIDFKNKKSLY